jgi:hypothetical protein
MLLRARSADITLSFVFIFAFACCWSAEPGLGGRHGGGDDGFGAGRRVADGRGVESAGPGHRTHHPAHGDCIAAASFVVFPIVLGVVHAEQSDDWLNAWSIRCGSLRRAADRLGERPLALLALPASLPKRRWRRSSSWSRCALLAVGVARMLAVPVFLTLFVMGVLLAFDERQKSLSYTDCPKATGCWPSSSLSSSAPRCPGRI